MSYAGRRRPPSPNGRSGDMHHFGGNNHHRDFEFRATHGNTAPSFSSGQRQYRDHPRTRDRARGSSRGGQRGQGHRYGGRRRFNASDREIFRARRSPTPEQMAGMHSTDSRFRILDDLPSQSESGEEEEEKDSGFIQLDGSFDVPEATDDTPANSDDMDMSSEDEHPRAKRARTIVAPNANDEAKPKWSNPDPYTSLPPPSESNGPKKDVVAMIRKAKVENGARSAETSQAAEFISLNFDEDGNEEEEGERPSSQDEAKATLRHRAPPGPRSNGDDRFHARESGRVSPDRWPPEPMRRPGYDHYHADARQRSRSPVRDYDRYASDRHSSRDERYISRYEADRYDPYEDRSQHRRSSRDDRYPPFENDRYAPPRSLSSYPPPPSYDDYGAPPLPSTRHPAPPGNSHAHAQVSREYDYDSEPSVREIGAGKRKRQERPTDIAPAHLEIVWGNDTPWMEFCRPQISNAGTMLHEELMSFTDYATPRRFERTMRDDLVRRVGQAFRFKYPNVEVRAFGSFATDMYLPVSDIDLVAMTSTYISTGIGDLGSNANKVRRIARDIIERGGLARSANPVPWAKVPIIKFKDIQTGIDVDISFENDSGLKAISTLADWKEKFPALRHLVYPIKHYLATRSLNDVSQGGLGGFSIICLIVHRLATLQREYSSEWLVGNLDFVLMDFFEHYGKKFDYRVYGLDMHSMRVISKSTWRGDRVPQPGRILIVDPNNPRNDLSGGSSKIAEVFRAFKSVFQSLVGQMNTIESQIRDTGRRGSILRCVLDTGFAKYEDQRKRLKRLHDQLYGSDRDRDVEFVSARPIGPGRSRNEAIDLTAADNQAMYISNLDGTYEHKSNRQRRNERHEQENQTSSNHIFFDTTPQAPEGQSSFPPMNNYLATFDAGPQANAQGGTVRPPPPAQSKTAKKKQRGGKKQKKEKDGHSATVSKPAQEGNAKVKKKKSQSKPADTIGTDQAASISRKARAAKTKATATVAAEVNKGSSSTQTAQQPQVDRLPQPAKPTRKETTSSGQGDKSRAAAFKKRFPGAQCPKSLTKTKYKEMVRQQQGA
ncbi:hypothetical protein CAC42_2721 [Sphaceloma murrayae]|uniref:polynucleotide adenylyltransferase n=1 Tax=Sphaceloma murrayae TaxID=2082308 RepID=A0A2K1R0N3_9PEZI|nr:hypothetical protein CAC42_2721 [Sphaceloma murrayae]